MDDWKRPKDFEELAEEKFEELIEDGDFTPADYEAFLSGALWAALLAEGRL